MVQIQREYDELHSTYVHHMDHDKPRTNEALNHNLFMDIKPVDVDEELSSNLDPIDLHYDPNVDSDLQYTMDMDSPHVMVTDVTDLSSADIAEYINVTIGSKIMDTKWHKELKYLLKRYRKQIAKAWADCGCIEGVSLKLDLKDAMASPCFTSISIVCAMCWD
eukprot:870021_1